MPKKFFRAPKNPVASEATLLISNKFAPLPVDPPAHRNPEEKQTEEDEKTTDVTTKTTKKTNPNPNLPRQTKISSIGSFYIEKATLQDPVGLSNYLRGYCKKALYAQINAHALILKPSCIDDHKTLDDILKRTKTDTELNYYFHRATTERRKRLIIRGLDTNLSCEELKTEITNQGITVHHLSELKKKIAPNTFEGFGLYAIEFNQSQINELKKIRHLMYIRINFEEPRDKDRIPLCLNCCAWGHTKNGCRRQPRCMGCAGLHNSAQCPVQDKINTQPKCANCTGAHPANYRECSFHLEAVRVRNQQLARLRAAREQRSSNTPAPNNAQQRTNFPSLATPAASAPAWWGQAAQSQSPQNPQPIGGQHALGALSELKELFDIVKGLNISKLITAAKTAINILKGPGDLLTKFLTAFQSIAEIF